MRLARLTARVLPVCLALVAAPPARAQEPVREYTPAPRYSTFQLGAQVTGRDNRGRDVLFSWGRMRTMGEGGAWMPWLGLSAGFTSGRDVIAGVVAGPVVGFGYALPGQYMSFGRATRAEPYVLAQAAAYGIGRFRGQLEAVEAGQDDGWGIAPALAAGIGLRLFADEWDVDLSTLEIVVEKRLGFGEDAAQLHVRFGRAVAPRERRDRGTDPGIATAAVAPPPPSPPAAIPPPADTMKPIPVPPPRGFLIPEDSVRALYALANRIYAHPRMSGPYPRNLVAVAFHRGASQAELRAAIDLIGGEVVGGDGIMYYVRISDDGSGNQLWSAVDRLTALPQVHIAVPELFTIGIVPAGSAPGDGVIRADAGRPAPRAANADTSWPLPARYYRRENLVECRSVLSWLPRCIPDVIAVRFRPGTTEAERRAAIDAVGTREAGGGGMYYVRIPMDSSLATLRRAVGTLRGLPQVEAAHPFFPITIDLDDPAPTPGSAAPPSLLARHAIALTPAPPGSRRSAGCGSQASRAHRLRRRGLSSTRRISPRAPRPFG